MKFADRKSLFAVLAAVAVLAAATGLALRGHAGSASKPRLVHTEPSAFAPVVVFEQYGERCMNFTEMDSGGRQTCRQLDDPDRMVFEYTRMMASALLVHPEPASVLIIGLGGGTLPTALHKLLPDVVIDTVELDPAVVNVARDYFGYETGPRQRVHVEDGRAYVERAHSEGRRYDMVMLDAFDVDYIPAHLLTLEFLQHVRGILAPDGVVVANSFTQSRMYERESATYAAVFGEFFNLRAGLEGNRVIVASPSELPDHATLQRNAAVLGDKLAGFGVEVDVALSRYATARSGPVKGEVLRD
jgi:spermidine synthase